MEHHEFGRSSVSHLQEVHPDLIEVCHRALFYSPYDFGILCGARNEQEQAERVASGASATLKSKHLPQRDGLSHAIDFGVYVGGKYINGDTPDEVGYYRAVNAAFVQAAIELSADKGESVVIEPGALWRTFVDAGHVQLGDRYRR